MNEKDPSGRTSAFALGRSAASALLVSFVLAPALAAQEDATPRVSGRVLGQERPVSSAQVFAWDVATYAVEKVLTDQKGQFLFESLPAGLYKIIAHKSGFVPAVEMLYRGSPQARQFVELELMAEEAGDVRQGETYWETRARIPADVLQQIRQLGLESGAPAADHLLAQAFQFEARMAAQGGVAQLGEGYGDAQLTDTALEVRGTLGPMRVGVDGRYLELASTDESSHIPDGGVQSMSLAVERPGEGRLAVSASTSDLTEMRGEEAVEVDLTNYRLGWSGQTAGGSSDFSAQLTEESNYYNSGLESGLQLPGASRTLDVQGTHRRDLTANTTLEAGLTYREREGYSLLNPDGSFKEGTELDQAVGVYGMAGSQIQPRVLVEYGVYSTMRENELSLVPHGGIVVKLGSDWEARSSFARRVEGRRSTEEGSPFERFNSAFFDDQDTCHQAGETCYEVTFERGDQENETLSVGAIHREFAETLRLYFSEDFFNRLESLLVVPGDEIPELKFRMVRQVSPKVLAKLESNIASGGGGIFYATDDRAYQNEVRYLVTSLDTRFQRTSTGVFLAFHHLEQVLNPVASAQDDPGGTHQELEIQRLQLMLTQDLSALANIAPSLALRFNMELSRGATPYQLTDDDELHKKLTGGISLSF